MSSAPRRTSAPKPAPTPTKGPQTAKQSLFRAVYNDETERARQIIETDPEQINFQDPYAGLTPLHVAVFRQNVAIATLIARHPVTDISARDQFGRRPIEMCIYTLNEEIHEAVFSRTYQAALIELENPDPTKIKPFKREP